MVHISCLSRSTCGEHRQHNSNG